MADLDSILDEGMQAVQTPAPAAAAPAAEAPAAEAPAAAAAAAPAPAPAAAAPAAASAVEEVGDDVVDEVSTSVPKPAAAAPSVSAVRNEVNQLMRQQLPSISVCFIPKPATTPLAHAPTPTPPHTYEQEMNKAEEAKTKKEPAAPWFGMSIDPTLIQHATTTKYTHRCADV